MSYLRRDNYLTKYRLDNVLKQIIMTLLHSNSILLFLIISVSDEMGVISGEKVLLNLEFNQKETQPVIFISC